MSKKDKRKASYILCFYVIVVLWLYPGCTMVVLWLLMDCKSSLHIYNQPLAPCLPSESNYTTFRIQYPYTFENHSTTDLYYDATNQTVGNVFPTCCVYHEPTCTVSPPLFSAITATRQAQSNIQDQLSIQKAILNFREENFMIRSQITKFTKILWHENLELYGMLPTQVLAAYTS